jgi:anti-anti-sigma regulatory factor
MLRIDNRTCNSGQTLIGIHGRIEAANLATLIAAVEASSALGPPVLDLQGVRFADATAVDQLRRWSAEGVTLQGSSLYLQALLAH